MEKTIKEVIDKSEQMFKEVEHKVKNEYDKILEELEKEKEIEHRHSS